MNSDLRNWKPVESRLSDWLGSSKHWAEASPANNDSWCTVVRLHCEELKLINKEVERYRGIPCLEVAYEWYFSQERHHVGLLNRLGSARTANSEMECFPQIWVEASNFLAQCVYLLSDAQEQVCRSVEVAFAHLKRRLVADLHYCSIWRGESYSDFQVDRIIKTIKNLEKNHKNLPDDFAKYIGYETFKEFEDVLRSDRKSALTKLREKCSDTQKDTLPNMDEVWNLFVGNCEKYKDANFDLSLKEVHFEMLGGEHFLLHKIWAFKINAAGERTDLVLETAIADDSLLKNVDGLVLTEWKFYKEGNVDNFIDQAIKQAARYSSGCLYATELRKRYIVIVSERGLPIDRDEREQNGIAYKIVNIAYNPESPSVEGRKK